MLMLTALALAAQASDAPKPTPGLCLYSAERVRMLSTSEELRDGRYFTAEQQAAGEARGREREKLAADLTARFGRARISHADMAMVDGMDNAAMLDLAHRCLALPK